MARARWIAYEDDVLARMERNAKLEAFAPRCAQNALKIASILAVSDNIADPRVTTQHLDWAIPFVERSLRDVISGYDAHVPLSEAAINAARILEFLKSNGGTATRRELLRGPLQRRVKRSQEIDDLLKLLA
jgi:hypothetical protein